MKTKYILIMILIGLGLNACVTKGRVAAGQVQKGRAKFGVNSALPGWIEKRFRGADYFEHEGQQAAIYIHAQCENISDSPLEALLAQITIGLTNIEVEKEERLMLAEREALVTEMKANIDGIPRFLKVMVLKKNRCVFDAVFNAPVANRALVTDFDRMIQSLWAEVKL